MLRLVELREKLWFEILSGEEEYFALVREAHMHIGAMFSTILGHNDVTPDTRLLQQSSETETNVDEDEIEEDIQVIELFLQGVAKGLSEDGHTLGHCYKAVTQDAEEVVKVIDLFAKLLENEIDYSMAPLILAKVYGHITATTRDCRVSDFLASLFNITGIMESVEIHKQELTTIVPSISMQIYSKHYEGVGIVLGKTFKLITGFFIY